MKVYKAIGAVMADLSKEGISKDSKNQQQGYNFRGIDAVYNALSGLMAKHGLLMLPRVLAREVAERTGKNGSALFYVTVEAEFDLIAVEDGSKHTVKTYGEAMDSGDKATNKAMSAAYKYAAMQAFCIPTEGDNDADATTHEVEPKQRQNNRAEAKNPAPTLNDRSDAFVQSINKAVTEADLDKVEALGSGLMAQLDTADPEKLVAIQELIAKRRDDMSIPFN